MKGDILASGGSSATFSQSSKDTPFVSDLKILSGERFREKHSLSQDLYDDLVRRLQEGLPISDAAYAIPPPEGLDEGHKGQETGELPQELQKSDRPSVGYEGEPLGDEILVIRVEKEHSSSLVIPDSLKARSDTGFVVAVGPEAKRVQKGNLILFDKFASCGADINLVDGDGIERQYVLLKEYDALMRLKKVVAMAPQASGQGQHGG